MIDLDRLFLARAVLFVGIVGGVLSGMFFLLFRPDPPTTFDVFYYAAKTSMSGEVRFETGHGLWVYTPVSLLFFYPYALLFDYPTAMIVHQVLSVLVAVGYGVILARFIACRTSIDRSDIVLVVGFTSLSVYPIVNVVNGSFVGMFTACLGVGWVLLEREHIGGGIAWALASLIKVFPALWGIYLLRVKAWRTTVAAILTGTSATLLGVFLFGFDSYIRYFGEAAGDRIRLRRFFQGGASPDNEAMTPVRGLAQLFPSVDPVVWTPVLFVVVVLLTGTVYYLLSTDTTTERATLLLATIIGIVFFMPTSQDMDTYLVYAPLLTLLYLEGDPKIHSLYAAGAVLISFNIGRDEVAAVSDLLVSPFGGLLQAVADPVLAFAHLPLLGLYLMYTGCLMKAFKYSSSSRK